MDGEPKPVPSSVPAVPGKVTPKRPRWQPAAPKKMSIGIGVIITVALVAAVGLVTTLHYLFAPKPVTTVPLGDEFRDFINENDFAFRPPRRWKIDDRREKYAYFVMPPTRERDFSPLMIFVSVTAPGQLPAYVDEHKKRTAIEEKTVKFISDEDDCIDGCRVKRLVYDCDYQETPESPVVKLRTLQFIIKDPSFPVFYRITCHSKLSTFDEHLASFEASAHSFRRVEIKVKMPKILN